MGAVGVLVVFELLQRRGIGDPREERIRGDFARPLRFAFGAGLLSAGLSAWWLTSCVPRWAAPCLGEHTQFVLRDILRYSSEEIAAFAARDLLK